MAGTVGAILNVAVRLGSAVGNSVVSTIEASVEERHGGPTKYAGRAASFWFLVGVCALELISMLVFYRVNEEGTVGEPEAVPRGKRGDVEKASTEVTSEYSEEK